LEFSAWNAQNYTRFVENSEKYVSISKITLIQKSFLIVTQYFNKSKNIIYINLFVIVLFLLFLYFCIASPPSHRKHYVFRNKNMYAAQVKKKNKKWSIMAGVDGRLWSRVRKHV